MLRVKRIALVLCLVTQCLALAEAQRKTEGKSGYVDSGFGGPAETGALMAEDDAAKVPFLKFPAFDSFLEPWFGWKKELREKYGFQLSLAYTSLFQWADSTLPSNEDSAASGVFRLTTRWDLVNRDVANTGTLVAGMDMRHKYSSIAPSDLGFEVGYLGIPGLLFSDIGSVLGDLNWQQFLNDNQTGFIVGRYDPNDFFDVLGYQNPWTLFQNLAIVLNPSIALPDWSTGIGGGHYFGDGWQVKATVNDANGSATDPQFFNDFGELYASAELSWSPSVDERYFKNVHVTFWHADEREEANIEESQGVAFGGSWTWDENFMLFTKFGWSDGTSPLYNASVTAGALYHLESRSDTVGLAMNWGRPSDDSLSDQVTGELFYRLQFAENLAITPSIQLLVDPALNPFEDMIVLGGIRIRLTL